MDDKEAKRTVSGKCGEELTYHFEDGVLSIEGTGPMFDLDKLTWGKWCT